jgi:hypothetical protein
MLNGHNAIFVKVHHDSKICSMPLIKKRHQQDLNLRGQAQQISSLPP